MSEIYYTCLSGMMAANYGLQNSSHNISNMQSPGFKRSDVFYASLGGDNFHQGLGVAIKGQKTNFSPGHYLDTENASDLAIIGQGYFIVRLNNGEYIYTRNGQFKFNADHFLIDTASNGRVMALDGHGHLVPISEKGPETSIGIASNNILVKGNIYYSEYKKDDTDPTPPDPTQGKYNPITFTVDNVYDTQGKAHRITLTLNCEAPENNELHWNVDKIECDDANISFDPQSIEFSSNIDGMANTNHSEIHFTMNGQQHITLDFGNYNKGADAALVLNKKSTNLDTNQISIIKQDGHAEGHQSGVSFDEFGQIHYHYDNEQKIAGLQLALARFDNDSEDLILGENNAFHAKGHAPTIGHANSHGLGILKSNQIESSNVDSTIEFGNIVVLQRMFQACSELMDIDKKLIEQLIEEK